MNLQLSDLDELLQSVRNRYAKEYLKEAIIAYRAGAYRASVISTWISICVDIIQKIKELSIEEDAAAKQLEATLNAIQPTDIRGMLDFENDLLRIANEDLGIISLIEKVHLERIKEDRNICAHPTFSVDGSQFVPPPELARSYIVQAANYLLVTPPLKGKVVVKRIFELITSGSFPSDQEKAFQVLNSEQYLGRVKDSAIRNIVIILFKRLFKDEDKMSFELLTQITSALAAINRINSEVFKMVGSDNLVKLLADSSDNTLKRLIPALERMPEIWRYVEEAIQHRLEQIIVNMEVKHLVFYRISTTASVIPSLNTHLKTALNKLTRAELKVVLQDSPAESLVDVAIDFFVTSGSFNSAYANGTQVLLNYVEFLTDERLSKTFDGVYANSSYRINQILEAGGISEFFAMLYSKTKTDRVIEHIKLWTDFRKYITEKGHNYPDLDGFMEADGIIKLEPVEID